MKIAREGYAPIGAAVAVSLAVSVVAGWWSAPLWGVTLFFLQFFREPTREVNAIAAAAGGVLSAADGRVVFVGKGASPVDDSEALKISVFMNVFNVHSNRAPVAGQVFYSERFAGGFFNAALDKASEKNERHIIAIRAGRYDIVSAQIAGLLARRVLCYVSSGDAVSVGQRYGFIRFGSRVDLYLPPASAPAVSLGDRVQAGVSVVAQLPPPDDARGDGEQSNRGGGGGGEQGGQDSQVNQNDQNQQHQQNKREQPA